MPEAPSPPCSRRPIGAENAVEIGTFTGYRALCFARGLPAEGTCSCCDICEEWTPSVARSTGPKAGVADRIELRLGPALETLAALPADATFDFAFIDADKPDYRELLRGVASAHAANGVIRVDNVLWGGR